MCLKANSKMVKLVYFMLCTFYQFKKSQWQGWEDSGDSCSLVSVLKASHSPPMLYSQASVMLNSVYDNLNCSLLPSLWSTFNYT